MDSPPATKFHQKTSACVVKMVGNTKPDVVILATGGIPLTTHFQGLENTHWMLAVDLLDGGLRVESASAFVIGGGLVGLETADFLTSQGVKVTLVEMLGEVGGDMDPLAKAMITKRLKGADVKIFTDTKVLSMKKNTVIAQQKGNEIVYPIETVVIAVGVRANREMPDKLLKRDLEVYVIGNAVEPRKALDAIQDGFYVGNKV